MILPISAAEIPRAEAMLQRCVEMGLRGRIAEPDRRSLGARIRDARLVPYQAVIGAREAAGELLTLRLRDGRRLDALPASEVLARIGALVEARATDLWDDRGD